MSKFRKPICLAGVALLATVLQATAAFGAEALTKLQRSEKIDLGRLGKVSEDERAVLRIEWRVGLNGVEEAYRVQEMMDNLRRMEGTMAAVKLLVRDMAAPKRSAEAAAPVAAPLADDSYAPDWRLMAANLAVLSLVAIWWRSRRSSLKSEAAAANEGDAIERIEPRPRAAIQAVPVAATTAKLAPAELAEARPVPAPSPPEADAPTAAAMPVEVATEALPTPPAPSLPASSAPGAVPAAPAQPAVDDEPHTQLIDFSLEELPEAPPEPAPAAPTKPPPVPSAKAPSPSAAGKAPDKPVEPTLQLAEIMLSMGLDEGAAQALVDYTEANPRHALHHWLKLLSIYRKRGQHQEFMAAAENLRKTFNIQAEYLLKPHSGKMPSLEDFARVAEHVQKIWARPEECIDYLQHLLEDNRGGERAGFPQSVAEEILLLVEMLKDRSAATQAGAA